ncbi:hypothetical protein [Parvicella tangerina]|uniref:Uncharacterized protein n=1 Tax=Parvicella tangerina TaxID=2829795 RepID=A0A916JPU3_9FLAO|nr:hypothetical protein [Parvicella tangerina]CAG5086301.1 hypothetical protein CRYO30217_03075 [Parvicella tangerina]
MRNHFLTFILLISCWGTTFCQEQEKTIEFEKRIEIDFKDEEVTVKGTYEIGEEGVLIYTTKEADKKGEGAQYTVNKYDVNLEKVDEVNISIPYKRFYSIVDKTDDKFYNLFVNSKKKSNEVTIVEVDQKTLKTKETIAKLPEKAFAKRFLVVGNIALISGSLKKEEFLVTVNLNTGKHEIVPLTFSQLAGCKRVKVNSISKIFGSDETLLFISGYLKKDKKVLVVTLDEKGQKKNEFVISDDLEKTVVSISGTKTGNDEFIFTGTYNSKSKVTSEGLYVCKTVGNSVDFVNFINYLDLSNFTSYLPEKKQAKIEKKKKKKKAKGKELTIDYFVASHHVINMNDGYLYIGECYYPTYRSEMRTTYVNGKPTTTYVTVFDGYQYTHAVLVKYDKEGNKVWDEIFDMSISHKPFYVKRFIHIADEKQESLKLAYATGSRIYSKEFDWDGKLIREETSEEIGSDEEGDKVKYTTSSMIFWYDNYFLSYGSQKIKNKESDKVKRKRIVYFLTKIKF